MNLKSNRLIKSIASIVLVFLEFLVLIYILQWIFNWLKPDKYAPLTNNDNLYIFIFAIVLAVVITSIITINIVQHDLSQIKKAEADILSVDETSKTLIDKADRLVDKYRNSETEVLSSKVPKTIMNSRDLRSFINGYPSLKSNEHTHKLLNQLETVEDAKLQIRQTYSSYVARYNEEINSFPAIMLKKIFGWEDKEMNAILKKDEIITDEELGI